MELSLAITHGSTICSDLSVIEGKYNKKRNRNRNCAVKFTFLLRRNYLYYIYNNFLIGRQGTRETEFHPKITGNN